VAGAARAVHDAEFQLDGDVIASTTTNVGGTTQLLDWGSFFNASGTPLALPPGFDASTFDRDFETNPNGTFNKSDSSTWATGSKDTLPITPTNWQCKRDQNLLDKNDIMNAYAASYAPAGGDEILYFALERNGNSGSANVGFWFLQDGNVNCESPGGNTPFAGSHTTGDLLVVSEFTQGGTVSTINVYEWVGGPNGSLNPNPVASGADCETTTVPPSDEACATVNRPPDGPTGNGTITTPWLTVNKFSVGHSLEQREFFEGGINLTDTGLGGKCFNTFLASTRASQELGANLHDFSRGQLGACVSSIETTPSVDGSTEIPANAQLSVTDTALVTVSGVSSFDATVSFHLCGPFAASATTLCNNDPNNPNTVGVPIGSPQAVTSSPATVNSVAATVTSVGRYCWRADFSGDADADVKPASDSRESECFVVTPRTPMLTTLAGPDVTLGSAVTDTATLSNTANRPGSGGPAGSTDGSINPTVPGGPAQGTITFTLYKADCTTLATGTGTNPQTVNVSGNNTYGPVSFTPDAVGVYTWVASYSGDSPNTNPAPASACPLDDENVVVGDVASVTSEQDWLPNDTATVATIGGSPLNGTLTFTLYPSADCTGTPVPGQTYQRTLTNATSLADRTKSTSNTTFKVTASASYSWKVTYDDTSPNVTDPAPVCETTSLTIDNDVPVGP